MSDEKWNSREVFGETEDIVIDVILTHPPCTFVVIADGPDPEVGKAYAKLIVPHWGEA